MNAYYLTIGFSSSSISRITNILQVRDAIDEDVILCLILGWGRSLMVQRKLTPPSPDSIQGRRRWEAQVELGSLS